MPKALQLVDKNIRSHILTDVLDDDPIDQSYKNLCREIGNDAITFYDFQYWYYRFSKLKPKLEFDKNIEKEPFPVYYYKSRCKQKIHAVGLYVDKSELIDDWSSCAFWEQVKPTVALVEKKAIALKYMDVDIRSHILTDVLEEVSVEDSYENLCKEMGNDTISFKEYQFWYNRFLKVKPELELDENAAKEPFHFSDLPMDTIGLIVKELELVDRLMLRHVSKPLRDFMNRQQSSRFTRLIVDFSSSSDCIEFHEHSFECVYFNCTTDLISLQYKDELILYAKNDATVVEKKREYCFREARSLVDDNYESEAFDDLEWLIKNPEVEVELFSFYSEFHNQSEEGNEMIGRCYNHLETILKSLDHPLPVRNLTIETVSPENVLAILPYLKPGYLETIHIHNINSCDSWKNARKIQRIVSSDQWKALETLHIKNLFEFFPVNKLTHLKYLHIGEDRRRPGALIRIRNVMVYSKTVVSCCFTPTYGYGPEDFKIGVPAPPTLPALNVRHYRIRNSNQYVEFQFQDKDVMIEKKTRE